MSADEELRAAEARLVAASQSLAEAVASRLEREGVLSDVETEIQRMTADRGRLARELDTALARSQRLERANREVSQRLVDAMERIRAILSPRSVEE